MDNQNKGTPSATRIMQPDEFQMQMIRGLGYLKMMDWYNDYVTQQHPADANLLKTVADNYKVVLAGFEPLVRAIWQNSRDGVTIRGKTEFLAEWQRLRGIVAGNKTQP